MEAVVIKIGLAAILAVLLMGAIRTFAQKWVPIQMFPVWIQGLFVLAIFLLALLWIF